MEQLRGKVAFVTGGASGVGLGQVKVFAEDAGMKVAIVDVQQRRLDEAMAYFQSKAVEVYPVLLDVTDRQAFAKVANEVEDALGPVQLLVNNAGVSARGPVENATYADWDWHIDVNINGVINGIQTFLPRLVERKLEAHIVNTASLSSFIAIPGAALYTTTKFAIRGLSQSLRAELDKYDIGVSCLCMASVNTNIVHASDTRPEKFSATGFHADDPDVIAKMKALLADGIDAVDLGRILLKAVNRNELWVFPYPEYIERIDREHQELLSAMNAFKDHADYARRRGLIAKEK